MSSNFAKYELNATKKVRGQKLPFTFNLTFYEDSKMAMEQIVKDLRKTNWEVNVLRETMVPWDLSES